MVRLTLRIDCFFSFFKAAAWAREKKENIFYSLLFALMQKVTKKSRTNDIQHIRSRSFTQLRCCCDFSYCICIVRLPDFDLAAFSETYNASLLPFLQKVSE